MGETVQMYQPAAGGRRTHNINVFAPAQLVSGESPLGPPVLVERQSDGTIARKECGPSFVICTLQPEDFWEFLRSWGGEWIWENVEDECQDLRWLADALVNGTAVLVTAGSFNKKRAPTVSGEGWVIACQKAGKFLCGPF